MSGQFRHDLDEVMARTKAFHAGTARGSALIEVASIRSPGPAVPKPDLTQWSFPDQAKGYLRALFDHEASNWAARGALADDRIPSVQPWFGIAEHSAYVGGHVSFSSDTSYHHSFITDWSMLDGLALDDANPWRRMLDEGFAFLRELAEGRCAVSVRGSYGPQELANTMRGNDLFTDFYESPGEVRRLMDFCARAIAWNIDRQRTVVGPYEGGIISGFKSWIPGERSFGQISEDASCLTGPALYAEFGRPWTERALADTNRVFVHTHGYGAAAIPAILEIGKVYMLEVSSDPNAPRGIEVFRKLDTDPGKIIGVLALTRQEIVDNLEFLKGRKTVIWYAAEDLEDARETVALVRRDLPAG